MGAHRLGIPTTSTIMYGHVETARHRAAHIATIRDIQKETGGITEFVPLSLIHEEAPMYRKGTVPGVRRGATGEEVMKMHAVARLMLNRAHQEHPGLLGQGGPEALPALPKRRRQRSRRHADQREHLDRRRRQPGPARPAARAAALDLGRRPHPAERTTTYSIRRTFADPSDNPVEPLDEAAEHPERFGSYFELIQMEKFRFRETYTKQYRGNDDASVGAGVYRKPCVTQH